MEKGLYIKNMWRQNKRNKELGFSSVTTSCTLEQVCVRMSSTYVCKLDHAYIDPYPETLINTETE